MSVFFIVNGGMLNSTMSFVFFGDEKDSETLNEEFNKMFSCMKFTVKNKTDIFIKPTPINLYRIPGITEDNFNDIMNKLLSNYLKTPEISKSGLKKFEDDVKNINFGYREMFDYDMWFISLSFTNIKKTVIEHMQGEGKTVKAFKYPSPIKETVKKTKTTKASKKSLEIEDDSTIESEKESDKESSLVAEKPKVQKKQVQKKKSSKKSSESRTTSSSLEFSDSEDEDNGIMRPTTKNPIVKKVEKQKKPATKPIKKQEEESDDDSDIEEEIITQKKDVKKEKEIDYLDELNNARQSMEDDSEYEDDDYIEIGDDDELMDPNHFSDDEDEEYMEDDD